MTFRRTRLPIALPVLLPVSLPVVVLYGLLGEVLGGCVPATVAPLAVGVGADIAILHRTIPDTIYSAVTGRDCSVVRLDRGQSYCRPVDPPVPPQPYCTRTLGRVECWAEPQRMPGLPQQVAQGPNALTPEQDRLRLARWPASLR